MIYKGLFQKMNKPLYRNLWDNKMTNPFALTTPFRVFAFWFRHIFRYNMGLTKTPPFYFRADCLLAYRISGEHIHLYNGCSGPLGPFVKNYIKNTENTVYTFRHTRFYNQTRNAIIKSCITEILMQITEKYPKTYEDIPHCKFRLPFDDWKVLDYRYPEKSIP